VSVRRSRHSGAEDEDLAAADRALAFERRKPAPLDLFGIAQLTLGFTRNAVASDWHHALSVAVNVAPDRRFRLFWG